MNDVLINKKISIERCVGQVRSYYGLASDLPFEKDHLRQDAIAMNLQRAVELCIDMANHLVRKKKLGLPQPALFTTLPSRDASRCCGWGVSRPSKPEA